MERARRHRGHLLAHPRAAGARWSSSATRSSRCALFDPTTQRSIDAARRADRAAARRRRRRRRRRVTLLDYLPPRRRWWSSTIPRCSRRRPTTRPRRRRSPSVLERLPAPGAAAARGRSAGRRLSMGTRGVGGYRGQFKTLAGEIRTWRAEGFTVRLVVDDERQAEHLRQILREHELEAWPDATLWSPEGLGVVVGECSAGFQIPALGLIVLTEEEIFGARRRRLRRPSSSAAPPSPPSPTSPSTTSWCTRTTASGAITACARCASSGRDGGLPAPRVRRGRPALPARRAARPHLEVPGRRRTARPASTGSAAPRGSA